MVLDLAGASKTGDASSFRWPKPFSTAFHKKNPSLVTHNLDRGEGTPTIESCATESTITSQLQVEDSLGREERIGNGGTNRYLLIPEDFTRKSRVRNILRDSE